MNLDLNNLQISDAVMHTIKKKEDPHQTGTPEFALEALVLDEAVIRVIKERLINAMGKASKAFQLDILHDHEGSFYHYAELLRDSEGDPDAFMGLSRHIATLLASSQTKSSIPGGYLLVLRCNEAGKKVIIVIKAEPHEALIKPEGQSQIALLTSVFLSPSQKLYKIGMLCDKEAFAAGDRDGLENNQQYDAFLFDDQFRIKSTPAEYFYKDFLGLTISLNAKIQSQKFYDLTEQFIMSSFEDVDAKTDLLRVLRDEFNLNQNPSVNPATFADTYFPQDVADTYKNEIQFELPSSIMKDPVLIKNKISKRRVEFSGQIVLSGPDEQFEERVKLINGNRLHEEIDRADAGRYTFVRIAGRPYSNE